MNRLFLLLAVLLATSSQLAVASEGAPHDVGQVAHVEHVHSTEHHAGDPILVYQVLGILIGATLLMEMFSRLMWGASFVGALLKIDGSFPLIIPVLAAGVVYYTGCQNGWIQSDASWMKDHNVNHSSLLGLWLFFAVLGAEIVIPRIVAAGAFVGLATAGGVLWPVLFTFGTISAANWWFALNIPYMAVGFVALGAGATDVPMSLGAMKIVRNALPATTAGLALDALKILAVGDDVAGVGIMAAVHGTNINMDFVVLEGVILSLAYFYGTHGFIEVREADEPTHESVKRTYYRDVTVRQPLIWYGLSLLNTYILYRAGLEPMLGGCLIFICSPTAVKHHVEKVLIGPALIMLLYFAFIAGAIDVQDSTAIGPVMWAVVFGGFLGKFKGIMAGALHGKALLKEGEYVGFPLRGTVAFSLCASANGTVAIIFVATALFKGKIEPWFAAQSTIGFLGTVVLAYIFAGLYVAYGWFARWSKEEIPEPA